MEWRTDPAILAFFVLVFLVSLPFALVKSRRHREETRAWLSGEDGHEPAATVPAGSVEPRRSLTRELAAGSPGTPGRRQRQGQILTVRGSSADAAAAAKREVEGGGALGEVRLLLLDITLLIVHRT
jgi:hypothetical protein